MKKNIHFDRFYSEYNPNNETYQVKVICGESVEVKPTQTDSNHLVSNDIHKVSCKKCLTKYYKGLKIKEYNVVFDELYDFSKEEEIYLELK